MIYACTMEYGAPETMAKVRPQHRSYLAALRHDGHVIAAGSFAEGDGALFLYEAESLEAARVFVEEDPFVKEHAIVSYKLRQYDIHGVTPALLRVTA